MRTGKTLYFDCAMGAAGDMLLGALFALAPAQDAFLQAFAALELPGVALTVQPVTQGETRGVQMELTVGGVTESSAQLPGAAPQHQHGQHLHHHHHHDHRSLPDVEAILAGLPVSAWVAEQARAVYGRIAAAEAAAHGVPVRQVHFHEVGALDAIGDVVGCCMLLEQLAPAYICASPVSTGRGTVRCAHGELPVPAPATAFLLQGIPTQPGPAAVTGELCTPTGAALLAQFAASFGPRPALAEAACGCGFGTKRFPLPNCVRAWLGYAPR